MFELFLNCHERLFLYYDSLELFGVFDLVINWSMLDNRLCSFLFEFWVCFRNFLHLLVGASCYLFIKEVNKACGVASRNIETFRWQENQD